MANYNPPTENLPIFDNSVFVSNETPVTIDYANKHYLKYPNAQGTENLQAITVSGSASFLSTQPPTSSQIIPASNDSSNKIPTTAWVQSVFAGALPIGIVLPYAGNTTPPADYLFCQGQYVSTTTYAALYAVIGNSYGSSTGTFRLPMMMSGNPNCGVFPAGSYAPNNLGFQLYGTDVNVVYPNLISTAVNAVNSNRPQTIGTGATPHHTHTLSFYSSSYVDGTNDTSNTTTGGSSKRLVSSSSANFPNATGDVVEITGNLQQQADYAPIYTAFTWIIKFQ